MPRHVIRMGMGYKRNSLPPVRIQPQPRLRKQNAAFDKLVGDRGFQAGCGRNLKSRHRQADGFCLRLFEAGQIMGIGGLGGCDFEFKAWNGVPRNRAVSSFAVRHSNGCGMVDTCIK